MKLLACGLVMVAAPAFADVETPGFVTMDRFDASSRAGGELSYLFPARYNSSTALRFDVHGQYVDPASGFGGYLSLPLGVVHDQDETEATVGDFEVGAIYAAKIPSPYLSVIARVGIALPTGSTDEKAQTNVVLFESSTLANTYQALPKGTSLRFSVSPIVRVGNVFGRLDLGIDKNLAQDQGDAEDAFFRLDVAIGVDVGPAALMAELVNLDTFSPNQNDRPSWLSQLALATRIHVPGIQPYAALVFPLNDQTRSVVDAALTIGAEVSLR